VDIDIKGCFNSIDHVRLLEQVREYMADGRARMVWLSRMYGQMRQRTGWPACPLLDRGLRSGSGAASLGGMIRTILHIDMDAYYASVEQRDQPALRGQPVVVGAAPDARGVVAAASYEARAYGIRSAMPSREAARRCPHAIFVSPRHAHYAAVSREIFAIFGRYTPEVEPLSIDEAFLDVTGVRKLFGEGPEIAERIRADLRRELGLTASAGVAPNKFLAKLASEMHKPDGLTVVPTAPLEIKAFLASLPVGRIWGVGPVLEQKLQAVGMLTIGDLQGASTGRLDAVAGRHVADHLRKLAMGEDLRAVETVTADKSLSREHTFSRDVRDAAILERTLAQLVRDVGQRLRAAGLYAGGVRIKIRWQGFRTITRQSQLDPPCCDASNLRDAALRLFRAEPLRQPVRLLGFGVQDLQAHPTQQLQLFAQDEGQRARRERLSQTVDALRQRYGEQSIAEGGMPQIRLEQE